MQKLDKKTGRLVIDRYLPHHFLAEKIVLSSLFISSEAVEIILRSITIETFYFKNHQEIYKAIITLYQKQISIDIITLTTFLQDNGRLDKVGGVKILTELINQIPNLVYLEDYLCLLQDKYLRRTLIQLGYQIINSGYITNVPLENILTDLETQLFNLTNETKSRKLLSSAELLFNVFSELKQKALNPSLSGLASGFCELDLITQGFQKSDLIIVAGRPAMGKTALCLNIATSIVKNFKLPVLFFSLEMSKEQLIYRLLANETQISNTSLRTGNINKKEWLNLSQTINRLSYLPFFIDDTANLSIQDIRLKVKKIIFEQTKIGLIVIDYLQLMQSSKFKTDNRVQELSQITRTLKTIAREFKVPIIALSQLSRNVESRVNKRPILSDLRESGSIEQDADLVLMLYRENYYNLNNLENDIAELIIAKHRNGPIGTVNLEFNAKHTQFSNYKNTN